MANKYLDKNFVEVEGKVISTGGADAGKIPALDGAGKLDVSLMPTGFAPLSIAVLSTETFSPGMFVNLYYDNGTLKCRKASCTDNTKPADGFVISGSESGATVNVFLSGNLISVLAGLTPAANYFLSTNGGITTTEPSVSGNVVQPIGKALSTTQLLFLNTGFRTLS
jgi:hypothetical protein